MEKIDNLSWWLDYYFANDIQQLTWATDTSSSKWVDEANEILGHVINCL